MEIKGTQSDNLLCFIKQINIVVDCFKQLSTETDKKNAFELFKQIGKSLESLLLERVTGKNPNRAGTTESLTNDKGQFGDLAERSDGTVSRTTASVDLAEEILGQIKGSLKETNTTNKGLVTTKTKINELHRKIDNLEKEDENRPLIKVGKGRPLSRTKRTTNSAKTESNIGDEKKYHSTSIDDGLKPIRKSARKKSADFKSLLESESEIDEGPPVKRKRQSTQGFVIKAAEKAPKLQIDIKGDAEDDHCSSNSGQSQINDDEDYISDGNDEIHVDEKQETKRRPGRPRKHPIRERPVRHHEKIVRHTCKICDKTFTHGRPFHKHLLEHGEGGASCKSCRKTFHNEAEYLHHSCLDPPKIITSSKAKSKCELCDIEFVNQRKLRIHMKKTHATTGTGYHCFHCDKGFDERALFLQHIKEHAENKELCLKCGIFMKTAGEYEQHMEEHVKNSPFMCEYCNKAFETQQTLIVHLYDHDNYSCIVCNDVFAQKSDLSNHYRETHNTSIPEDCTAGEHLCEICNERYVKAEQLEDHFRLHSGEKPLQCDPCGLTFPSKKALLCHRYTSAHTMKVEEEPTDNLKEYLCSSCGKSYFTKAALQRHMRYHVDVKPYCCKYCAYTCREPNNLKRHMDLHFSERNFVCEICGAAFHAKKTLETHHIYKHEEQREFKCSDCALSFKTRSSLKRHERVHSQTRPHKCQTCGTGFNRLYNLRRHMKAVHGNDQVLPPVNRVKLLDAPPGKEYHKGPAALGLQGKPKTPAQLLEECKPTRKKSELTETVSEVEERKDSASSNPEISVPVSNTQLINVTTDQNNIVAQAAAAVGLAHATQESKVIPGIAAASRIIYQTHPTENLGTPVAVEMKLNANEAAQMQAQLQKQEQFLSTRQHLVPHTQPEIPSTSSDIKLKTVAQLAPSNVSNTLQPNYTIPFTHQSVQGNSGISQVPNPLLQRILSNNPLMVQSSEIVTLSSVNSQQGQILHQAMQLLQQPQQPQFSNQTMVKQQQSSSQQNTMQIPQSNVQQQLNLIRPQTVQAHDTTQNAMQQHQQQQQQQQQLGPKQSEFQSPVILQQPANYYATLPEYAQDLFTATNTVSNLAQMRELIHGTPQSNTGTDGQ